MEKDFEKLIGKYLNILEQDGEPNEIYKYNAINHFQENWDIYATDFYEMFKKAFSKKSNLLYQNSYGFIEKAAQFFPNEARSLFQNLYDENFDIKSRITRFQASCDDLLLNLKSRLSKDKFNAQQDERTISVYLAFRYPDKYILYKPDYYDYFCEQVGIQTEKTGKKFLHLLEKSRELSTNHILKDEFFEKTYRNYYAEPKWDDTLLKIQNILYVVYRDEKDSMINQKIINAIFSIGKEKTLKFYTMIDKINSFLNIDSRSDKIVFGFREDENLLSVTIGQRYCLSLKYKNGAWLWGFISASKLEEWHQDYEGTPTAYYNYTQDDTKLDDNFQEILDLSQQEFNRVISKSGYIKHNHKDFRRSVFDRDFRNDLFYIAFNSEKSTEMSETKIANFPLNQILYGAPGTGKTFTTKKLAIEIIDNKIYEEREEINDRYEELVNSNQIQFVTFHQSMSYEDFIEGIKPITNDNQVTYELVDGLFKKIAYLSSQEPINYGESGSTTNVYFEDAWDYLTQLVNSSEHSKFVLKSLTGTEIEIIEISNQGNLILKPKVENGLEYTISFNRAKKLFDAFPSLESISNIDKEFRSVIGGSYSTGYWAVVNFLNNWRVEKLKVKSSIKNQTTKKFVLIIDEINRGNVSSIFGELITLIEEDKRKGILQPRKETLEVILPYSKDNFFVPDNLYIIGTMNTADRSVEALDTALRRRFSFVEMAPNYEVLRPEALLHNVLWKYKDVPWKSSEWKSIESNLNELFTFKENWHASKEKIWNNFKPENRLIDIESLTPFIIPSINLSHLLQTINSRIEILLDKNHQIGHAYLINIESFEDLVYVFKNKIIPLLEEYFYGDYGKIGLVLGSAFIQEAQRSMGFADFDYEDAELLKEKKVWEFTKSENWIIASFQSIYA